MQFEETTENVLEIPKELCTECFIYFLLQGSEVVYVGQTTRGICRPVEHIRYKEFTTIKMFPCTEALLDETESYYIDKYKPIYNKRDWVSSSTGAGRVQLLTARNKIRQRTVAKDITVPQLKRLIKEHNYPLKEFKGKYYIANSDLEDLMYRWIGVE